MVGEERRGGEEKRDKQKEEERGRLASREKRGPREEETGGMGEMSEKKLRRRGQKFKKKSDKGMEKRGVDRSK